MDLQSTYERITAICPTPALACNLAGVSELHLEPLNGRKAASPRQASSADRVAHLRLQGVISQHPSFWGGTSTIAFGKAFDAAILDTRVGSILIEVNSPGGDVRGTAELAEKIYHARYRKEIIAHVNSDMHSAALWIGSAAHKVHITPGGSAGSIGVWTAHVDQSRMLGEIGLNVSLIYSGEYKVEGNPFEPLSKDARAFVQSEVDDIHQQFIRAVAKHRGVTTAAVARDFGRGRSFNARKALEVGMVDRIQTLENLQHDLTMTQVERRKAAMATRQRLAQLRKQ